MPKWRGTKGQGLRFQRAAAHRIPNSFPDRWFQYWDAKGDGYCSPDILLADGQTTVIIECKLTWTPNAEAQIRELYAPVIEMAFKRPTIGIVITRHLTPATPQDTLVTTLAQALAVARRGHVPTIHWLGRGPI